MKVFELQEILSRFDPNDEEYDEESCVLEVILPNDTYLEQCTNSLEDRCD